MVSGLAVRDVSIEAHLHKAAEAERVFDWQDAWDHYEAAATLAPREHRIRANQGNVAWLAARAQDAHFAYRRALLLNPACPISLRGLGNVKRDLNEFEAADRAYAVSLQLNADPLTAWNHSQVLIGLERYGEAYASAELRLKLESHDLYRRDPFWDGAIASLTREEGPLHVWSEQGLGDTLQYIRWIPTLLARLPPHAFVPVLEVEPCLVRLLEQGLSWLPRAPRVVAKTETSPLPCSAPHMSLLSLPHHLGDAPHPGLPPGEPYLRNPAWVRRRCEPAAGSAARPQRLGLVWAAGRKLDDPFQAREYHQRSLPPQALELLLDGLQHRGHEVVNLQVGPDRSPPGNLSSRFETAMPATHDFADTATFVADLDRVITVDTAMAHLLGAVAHPAWVLLPFSADPRWHRGTEHCPWHPGLRLFRQPAPGDWVSVIQAVLAALDAEAAAAL